MEQGDGREGVGMPGKGDRGRKEERRGKEGERRKEHPLRQFLPTPLVVVVVLFAF